MSSNTQDKCIHHWLIEPAAGPYSKGTCKLCHKISNFENSVRVDGIGSQQGFDYWHKDIVGDRWKANLD